jgi:hypothetical protein
LCIQSKSYVSFLMFPLQNACKFCFSKLQFQFLITCLGIKSPNLGALTLLWWVQCHYQSDIWNYWNLDLRYHMLLFHALNLLWLTNITCFSIHWSMWHLLGEEALN